MTDTIRKKPSTVRSERLRKRLLESIPYVFAVVTCSLLWVGHRLKKYELISPDRGNGLFLGVTGAAVMIILLLYPLRKRVRFFERLGPMRRWFQVHMALGIIGPLCILYHANFSLGSINSNVALFSMLVVSGSGVLGRYIYSKIHHGLYGQRAQLIELKEFLASQKDEIEQRLSLIPGVKDELTAFADKVITPTPSFTQSLRRVLLMAWTKHRTYLRTCRMTRAFLKGHAKEKSWGPDRERRTRLWIERETRRFLQQSDRVAKFNFYERLFSFWHAMHVPLVFVLVIAIIVHITAVNLY